MSTPPTIVNVPIADDCECGLQHIRVLIVGSETTGGVLRYSAPTWGLSWKCEPSLPSHNMILPDDPRVVPSTRDILAAHGMVTR